jgi:hypothetical protein
VAHRNYPKNLRLAKPAEMTIHWKALEQHFPMMPLVFQVNHHRGKIVIFYIFLKTPQFIKLKELIENIPGR